MCDLSNRIAVAVHICPIIEEDRIRKTVKVHMQSVISDTCCLITGL